MTLFGIDQHLRRALARKLTCYARRVASSGPHVVHQSCYMNAPTVFSIMATRLPQTQELHTNGLNTPVVTRQGVLSGWKQGTPKCHSGTDHWNIWILYSTTFMWALQHRACHQEIVSEQNPRTYGWVTQAYWELYQSTRLVAGQFHKQRTVCRDTQNEKC